MNRLEGQKILVTGPAGQIAFPLASRLALDNEVWGIARFSDETSRQRVEDAGIQTRAVDLAEPVWGDLPADFDYVLHLAASIVPGHDYATAIRINAEGTGHVMSRFRNAKACLVMSTCGVYASPDDAHHGVLEDDPLGGSPQPYAPTYCVSKISQEAVAKFCATTFELPTILARMNAAYGDNGGLAAMLLDVILAGYPIPLLKGRDPIASPIHEDDIFDQTPGLLAAASIPATITNWGGDEPVDIRELCRFMAELAGCEVEFVESDDGIHQYWIDPTRRIELAGPCRVPWREGVTRMIATRQSDLPAGNT
ncbi:NAD(P)-dependent oxidoreductase [Myxococcota bacterium]|nr:NAD(P)-dependent oxidoreductase [Myxococcota bacterium]